MEWAMSKKEKPGVLVREVVCLHEGVKMRVKVDSERSMEFDIKTGVLQEYAM